MFHSFEERCIECKLVSFLNTVLEVLSTSRCFVGLYHRGCLSARPIRRSGDVRCRGCVRGGHAPHRHSSAKGHGTSVMTPSHVQSKPFCNVVSTLYWFIQTLPNLGERPSDQVQIIHLDFSCSHPLTYIYMPNYIKTDTYDSDCHSERTVYHRTPT